MEALGLNRKHLGLETSGVVKYALTFSQAQLGMLFSRQTLIFFYQEFYQIKKQHC
ncbi:hypothetical protein RintRC_2224 [Richelia intracellularis]|nr:hypothetical protein RintRC_2224 [Richelia intracellularis]